ncbi:MAG: hemerythrin domain-containing protein [Chloroflexi bacterium]|nr:hemerythrin domain-containing protein [Chloroflexota bacterium]
MTDAAGRPGAAEQFSPDQLREYHEKIKRHIKLMERVSTDLDVVDMAYKLGNWVEMAGLEGEEGEQKLSWLLTAFERIIERHFIWEEKHLLPRFDRRGAAEFSQRLAREHQECRQMFKALHGKIAGFELMGGGDPKKKSREEEIKSDLHSLLRQVEGHAMDEEDAFFLVDHNI